MDTSLGELWKPPTGNWKWELRPTFATECGTQYPGKVWRDDTGKWTFKSGFSIRPSDVPREVREVIAEIERRWPTPSDQTYGFLLTSATPTPSPTAELDTVDPALVPASKADVDLVDALAIVKNQLRTQVAIKRILQVSLVLSSLCSFLHWLGCAS